MEHFEGSWSELHFPIVYETTIRVFVTFLCVINTTLNRVAVGRTTPRQAGQCITSKDYPVGKAISHKRTTLQQTKQHIFMQDNTP